MKDEIITLSHGSGGIESYNLIQDIFYENFANEELMQSGDSSILNKINSRIATTIDGFVVDPVFFHGGDIGRLSICGTVNDLSVSGAKPLYINASFIIEEGFEISSLRKIVKSMADTAKIAKVKIVAGDTKVVERRKCHKIYIATSGIGEFEKDKNILNAKSIISGDKIILSGTIGDHGACIMSLRDNLCIENNIKSDCAPLNNLCEDILNCSENIRIMRDPTRGGLANTLNELALLSNKSMKIYENKIPIKEEIKDFCELLGLDPMYIANEGKLICIADKNDAERVLQIMRKNPLGKDAEIIGEVIDDDKKSVYMETLLKSTKKLSMAKGELLPRIC